MSRNFGSIDRDIFQYQAVGIAEEMSRALRRTAYSSIIWDSYDYACAVFSAGGEMLAQAKSIPCQLGIMSTALAHMLRRFPADVWRPGDVFICNDPYLGCTHTPDITLFSPVFSRGEMVAITSTIAHHIDIGGKVPSTTAVDNIEVFGEGLIFPPTRLIDSGTVNQTVLDFIAANVRQPDACMGDLRAQIAGCRTAERRLESMALAYGNDSFRQLGIACLDYGERYMRAALADLPSGTRSAEIEMEDGVASDSNVTLKVTVSTRGDEITIDFTGTAAQRAFALNCPWSSTVSMAIYAVKALTAPDLPQNDGFTRPIKVVAPPGTLVNPARPAAVGSRQWTQQVVADVVLKALSELAPAHSAAGCHTSFPVFRAAGLDDRPRAMEGGAPRRYVIMSMKGGGMGASAAGDGMNAVDTHASNCSLLSAEVMETLSPVRVRASRLVPGSGGTGQHRGGLAIERDYEILAGEALVAGQLQQASARTAPWGAQGGADGLPAAAVLNPGSPGEQALPARLRHTVMKRGDIVRMRSAGGGGYGDPAARSDADRERDRAEGYV